MKKITIIMVFLLSMFVMAACSEEKDAIDKSADTTEVNNDAEAADEESEDDGANELGIEEGDQLDLGIGDTGKIDSIHGVFELTLDDAKLLKMN